MIETYRILRNVNLRRTPRVINWPSNKVGMYEQGDADVKVLDTIIDRKGWKWGRVTEPDVHRKAIWFCIKSLHTEFAEKVGGSEPPQPPANWSQELDDWARTMGYKGVRP